MNDVVTSDYVPSDDEPFMNERQKLYFRAKLVTWKSDILREARETLEILQQENANHPDLADRASSETDRAIELRARDRQRKLIAKIDSALQRIEEGTYGYCEETGEPIALKRLDARPIATLVDRGAGAPRTSREGLSRRLSRRHQVLQAKKAASSRLFLWPRRLCATACGWTVRREAWSSRRRASSRWPSAGPLGGGASKLTSSSRISVSSRLFERAAGGGGGGCLIDREGPVAGMLAGGSRWGAGRGGGAWSRIGARAAGAGAGRGRSPAVPAAAAAPCARAAAAHSRAPPWREPGPWPGRVRDARALAGAGSLALSPMKAGLRDWP